MLGFHIVQLPTQNFTISFFYPSSSALSLGRTIFTFPISFSSAAFGLPVYLEFAVTVSLQAGKAGKLFVVHVGCLDIHLPLEERRLFRGAKISLSV